MLTELVEEHWIGALPRGPTPPLVQNRDDIVEVDFGKAPDLHLPEGADITNATKTHEPPRETASARESSTPRILFCPFCGEAFEGIEECPEHELTLVPVDRLPRRVGRGSGDVSFFMDPRHGRGGVLLGASMVMLGFVLPLVESRGVVASALEVAIDGAANLWLTPGAAIAQLWILWSRRAVAPMRAARGAVLGLAIGGGLPLLYTMRRIATMADAYSTDTHWLAGLFVMVAGLLLVGLWSRRLGAG